MIKVRILLFLLLTSLTFSNMFAGQKNPEKLYQKALKTSVKQGIKLMEESAEMDYLPAQEVLVGIYVFGIDINDRWYCKSSTNNTKGFMWSSRAAEQGSFIGKVGLAYCLDCGLGTDVDHDKALQMWIPIVEQFDGHNQLQKQIIEKSLSSFYDIERTWYYAHRKLKKEFQKNVDRIFVVDMICYKFGYDFMTEKELAEAKEKRDDDPIIKDYGMGGRAYFERSYIYGHPKGSEYFMKEVELKRIRAVKKYNDIQEKEKKLNRMKEETETAVNEGTPKPLNSDYKNLLDIWMTYPRLRPLLESISNFYLVNEFTFLPIKKENYEGLFSNRNTSQDQGYILAAIKVCMNEKSPKYRNYYDQCANKLNKQLQDISKMKGIVRAEIEEEMLSYLANTSSRSRDYSSSDGNSISVPDIKEVERGSHGRKSDKDYDYTDDDTYIFEDGVSIKVYHRYREGGGHSSFLSLGSSLNYYYPDNLKANKYKSAEDAARAGWVWKKENLERTIGAIKD